MPGPYTLSGRLLPNDLYPDRFAVTEALLPLVRKELEDLVEKPEVGEAPSNLQTIAANILRRFLPTAITRDAVSEM